MDLTPKAFVKNRFKMLEYYRVCSAFESACDEPFGPELTADGLSRVAAKSPRPKHRNPEPLNPEPGAA